MDVSEEEKMGNVMQVYRHRLPQAYKFDLGCIFGYVSAVTCS